MLHAFNHTVVTVVKLQHMRLQPKALKELFVLIAALIFTQHLFVVIDLVKLGNCQLYRLLFLGARE